MSRSSWMPRWGDINGLFGLLLDNAAALVLLYTLLAYPGYRENRFSQSFVMTWMIPGTVLGVLLGGVLYAALARRLAQRSGRQDVTAMPVGLDTPSVFGIALFVLLPALAEGRKAFADRGLGEQELHDLASLFAWNVGAVVLVLVGLFKTVLAPLGGVVRSWVPRAALLGSMAAIALALIAFLPMARHIAPAPVVGIPVLMVVLVTLLVRSGTHDAIPGSVLALVVGVVIVVIGVMLGEWQGWNSVPLPERGLVHPRSVASLPPEVWESAWWGPVWWFALAKLPLALPFALFTLVGGVQCAESAAAAGDEYDTRSVLLVQGVASTVAGLLGGVVQTTPYFGHPAYKKMGAGWAYAVLATLVLALLGYFGLFSRFFEWLPGAVLFPVIIYVGLQTIAHSFEATPRRDYAAMALATMPVLAYLIVVSADEIYAGRTPAADAVVYWQGLRCLGNGFILTSLLWAAALTLVMDGRPGRATVPLLIAAGCSLVGLIHSPLSGAPLAWPHKVWEELAHASNLRLQYQSPFHWAAAYVLAAGVVLVDSLLPAKAAARRETETSPRAPELVATAPQPAPGVAGPR